MPDPIAMILSVPAIVAIVTITKDLGVPAKLAPIIAITVGITLTVANTYLADTPVWGAIAAGLILGLSASGLYDTAKITGNTTPRRAQP